MCFIVSGKYPPAARGEDEAQGLSDEGMHAGGSGTNAPAPDSRLRSSQRPPVRPVFSPNHLVPDDAHNTPLEKVQIPPEP